MRIINRTTLTIVYDMKEYHRLQYNHACNGKSNSVKLYIFNRPTDITGHDGVLIYEDDIVETRFLIDDEVQYCTYHVKFKKGSCVTGYSLQDNNAPKTIHIHEFPTSLKVIGNIHNAK